MESIILRWAKVKTPNSNLCYCYSYRVLTSGGRGGNAPGRPGGRGAPFWYGNPGAKSAPGGLWKPGGNPAPGGGGGGAPGVGGLPLVCPPGGGGPPGCPLGVVGLLPGVPGLSPWAPLSPFGLRDGVDLDEDDMFEGGLRFEEGH